MNTGACEMLQGATWLAHEEEDHIHRWLGGHAYSLALGMHRYANYILYLWLFRL